MIDSHRQWKRKGYIMWFVAFACMIVAIVMATSVSGLILQLLFIVIACLYSGLQGAIITGLYIDKLKQQ